MKTTNADSPPVHKKVKDLSTRGNGAYSKDTQGIGFNLGLYLRTLLETLLYTLSLWVPPTMDPLELYIVLSESTLRQWPELGSIPSVYMENGTDDRHT
eukprot:4051465-Amphidinium_carterae.1